METGLRPMPQEAMKMRQQGKFWPRVRALIWEKAQQLFQEEQARTMGADFKGITATKKELRENGHFHRAKIIVLSNLYRQKKGLPTVEEEELIRQYGEQSLQCYSKNHSSRKSEKEEKHKLDGLASADTKSAANTESAGADSANQKATSLLNVGFSRSLEK
jgi:hypothetical protein